MAMFAFGGRRKVRGFRGDEQEVGELALHIQCAWRITQAERIIVASSDLYYPADYCEGREIPPEFDWDRDPNRLDALIRQLFEKTGSEYVVQSVNARAAGILHIGLTRELCMDLLPDVSLNMEHWRLFAHGKHPHFVVTGSGIEVEPSD